MDKAIILKLFNGDTSVF